MAGEDDKGPESGKKIDRRDVLRGLSTVPALGLFGYAWRKQHEYQQRQKEAASATRPAPPANLSEINLALLGAGAQGEVLLNAMLRIPGLRFRAVCDIWKEYNQKRAVNTLRKYKFEVNGYEDYREMLDKEKELDAVVIATPDFWHAPHAVDCLTARRRCRTPWRARGAWPSPPGRPRSCSRSGTSGAAIRATCTAARSCSWKRGCSGGS